MSDFMGNYRGGGSGSTPYWLLRQQKKAIKQAGKKLQEIDKQYSTKILKDDIQAESLLTDIGETKLIAGTTVGGVIQCGNNQVILVHNKLGGRGFPKGGLETGEDEQACLFREIQEETGVLKNNLKLIKRLREYEGYSANHGIHKKYVRYLLELINQNIALGSNDPDILEVQKFDTESVLDILETEHQKNFWKSYYLQ